MDLPALLDAAKRGKGSLKEIAAELGIHPNRLSDWRAGRLKPNASEIAYLAECANLPILETVADIESQLDDQHANIWKKALGNLRAAGVAATVMLTLAISSAMGYSGDAHAAGFENYPLRQASMLLDSKAGYPAFLFFCASKLQWFCAQIVTGPEGSPDDPGLGGASRKTISWFAQFSHFPQSLQRRSVPGHAGVPMYRADHEIGDR